MTEAREQALDRLTDWAEPVEILKPPKRKAPDRAEEIPDDE